MWEIGELTAAQLKDMRDIAAKDANSQWNNVHTGAQEARQKVLDEFSLREKFFQSKWITDTVVLFLTDFINVDRMLTIPLW